jgi:small-conductance mechanosensitive channel
MRELLPVIGSSVFFDLLKSILLLLFLLIARTVLVRWIKGNHTLTIDAKRRWIVTARNSMVLGLFVGLVVIWAHELEAFAVSLVALAATVVLATKELILCWSGAALRVGGGVYGVGDRIQLGTYRGVVLEYDVFATKLLEIGPGQTSHLYTGRTVVFPNSLLFGNPLIYVVSVPLQSTDDWQAAEQALLNAAKVECASFMDQMGRQMKLLEQRNLLEAPSPEPRITIQLPEAGRIHLVLRFPAPDRGRSRVEQAILRRYLIAVRP